MTSPMFSPAPGTDGRIDPIPNPQETVDALRRRLKTKVSLQAVQLLLDSNPIAYYYGQDYGKWVIREHGKSFMVVYHARGIHSLEEMPETLPNTQSPELAEPHVVQPPQESSPGEFEEVLDRVLTDYRMTSRLEDEDGGERYARKNAKGPILVAHQKEIQAAKREGMQQARNVLHNHGWYDACATLDQMIKRELEEETIS